MIFARYRGLAGDGNFTKGKTYLARPQLDGTDAVDFDSLYMIDNDGKRIVIDPDNERFEYFEKVYAVLLREVKERPQGSVVVADEISQDGDLLRVRDIGYLKMKILEILDETNLVPGMWVMDMKTGIWTMVERVDERMWIMPDGFSKMRSPDEFCFAVSDGDLVVEPLVRCIDNEGTEGLTVGALYRLTMSKDGMVGIVNDEEHNMSYLETRFDKKI